MWQRIKNFMGPDETRSEHEISAMITRRTRGNEEGFGELPVGQSADFVGHVEPSPWHGRHTVEGQDPTTKQTAVLLGKLIGIDWKLTLLIDKRFEIFFNCTTRIRLLTYLNGKLQFRQNGAHSHWSRNGLAEFQLLLEIWNYENADCNQIHDYRFKLDKLKIILLN